MDERQADIMIALLARLVASNTAGDEVLALTAAGLTPSEVARILGMKPNAVSMRLARAKKGSSSK